MGRLLYEADYHQDCATAWAMAGAAVFILVGRNVGALNLTAGHIKIIAGSAAIIVQGTDITSESSVKTLYEKIATHFKVVDVLINNAATLEYQNTGDIEARSVVARLCELPSLVGETAFWAGI